MPERGVATSERITDWARSGVLTLSGHQTGPPLVPPGRAATVARDISARLAEATGGAVRVDGAALLGERAAFTGYSRGGTISPGGACRLLPTLDGWAAVSCARQDDPLLLGALVGRELPENPWPALAAWLAEHTGQELAERAALLGLAAGPVAVPNSAPLPERRPIRSAADLLVVDFSALWAGPLCANLLGLAGARVVKVETLDRPDGARCGHPDFYDLLHHGHRSVALDPRTRSGRRALAGLVATADIVIEASRPRALAGFGLDAACAVEAGTVWVSITAYGRASDRVGFGDDVAAASGLVARTDDGSPVFCGDALADPLTGLVAAELALTEPTGGAGVLLDVSMSSVVSSTLDTTAGSRPAPAAYRAGGQWLVDAECGPTPVQAPRHRVIPGRAADSGVHTNEVLRELKVPLP